MFEIVNRRRTDGRTPEHGYTISSPCDPEGSGELKSQKTVALMLSLSSLIVALCSKPLIFLLIVALT